MQPTSLPHVELQKRFNLNVLGDGPLTLLLVHGYGCNQAMWRRIAPELAATYRVILLDLVGFGKSDFESWTPDRYSDLCGYARDVLEIAWAYDETPIIYVGHSIGSMIGVMAESLDEGAFAAHVMVAPSPSFTNDGTYLGGFAREDLEKLLLGQRDMAQWSELVAGMVMMQPGTSDLTLELVQSFCNAHPLASRALARATFLGDYRSNIAIEKPVLILQSSNDDLVHPSTAEYMKTKIRGCELQYVESWGHCPHLVSPDACLRAVRTFIDRVASKLNN